MARVSQVLSPRRPAEGHRERLTEGQATCDPQLERQTDAEPALDRADPRLGEPDTAAELGLTQPQVTPPDAGLATERGGDPPRFGNACGP